jgi:Na+/alanine symporter
MAIPNIIGLYILAPSLKRDVKAYIAKLKAS